MIADNNERKKESQNLSTPNPREQKRGKVAKEDVQEPYRYRICQVIDFLSDWSVMG